MWLYLNMSYQSPTAKSTDIVRECFSVSWEMKIYDTLQYGMTFELYLSTIFQDVLILSTGDFPARISALQDMEQAWRESEADCFSRSLGCVEKLSQDSS